MVVQRSVIFQNLYEESCPPITLQCVNLSSMPRNLIDEFEPTITDGLIGVAGGYSSTNGTLEGFALSSETHILLITLESDWESDASGKNALQDTILSNPSIKKYGWSMPRLATALHSKADVRIKMAFDVQQQAYNTHPRGSVNAIIGILSGVNRLIDNSIVTETFQDETFDATATQKLALRAWSAWKIATLPSSKSTIRKTQAIDTTTTPEEDMAFLESSIRIAAQLQAMKPLATKSDDNTKISTEGGLVTVESSRYKNRIRPKQKLQIETVDGDFIMARVDSVQGKTAKLRPTRPIYDRKTIVSISAVGKDDLTVAEAQRDTVLAKGLQNPDVLTRNPWIRMIWMPSTYVDEIEWPTSKLEPQEEPIELDFDMRDLNTSQENAVKDALNRGDGLDRITMIIGPPGTGKTTVITAITMSIMNGTEDETVWIIAQSNVAVRNIAEKLVDSKMDFKLLVSSDFSFEWHDHLYSDAELNPNVIQSSDFSSKKDDNEALLKGTRVILCTLSMLSNPKLRNGGFTELVPLTTLLIDEASQIELSEYLPLFFQNGSSLEKIVFIGDDKQLAPFGQEEIEGLQSIFEVRHLRERAIFLDTQYRMPHFIGNFISDHVYDGKLITSHAIASKLSCRIADVQYGREEHPQDGTSWINNEEARAVVLVAKKYNNEYRKYKVITPYDAQRDLVERSLKDAGLKWEDTVFNVDAFQGNEDDHIIISLVRSYGTGFLKNERRTNVMLSRCRKSMIICSSRKFLERKDVANTLVGKLAAHIEYHSREEGWIAWDRLRRGDWP